MKTIQPYLTSIQIDKESKIELGDLYIGVDPAVDKSHAQFYIYVATKLRLDFIEKMRKHNSGVMYYKVKDITGLININP